MDSKQTRRANLKAWVSSQPVATVTAWARAAGISYKTANLDIKSLADDGFQIEPWMQGGKIMGFVVKEVA